MSVKKAQNKKRKKFKNINSLISNNLKLDKININPFNVIEETKSKIGNFYTNIKKQREKEKIRREKKGK